MFKDRSSIDCICINFSEKEKHWNGFMVVTIWEMFLLKRKFSLFSFDIVSIELPKMETEKHIVTKFSKQNRKKLYWLIISQYLQRVNEQSNRLLFNWPTISKKKLKRKEFEKKKNRSIGKSQNRHYHEYQANIFLLYKNVKYKNVNKLTRALTYIYQGRENKSQWFLFIQIFAKEKKMKQAKWTTN